MDQFKDIEAFVAVAQLGSFVKAADKLCAYMKCLQETAAGNREFSKAEESLRAAVEAIELEEVEYFLREFVPSLKLTLDELG